MGGSLSASSSLGSHCGPSQHSPGAPTPLSRSPAKSKPCIADVNQQVNAGQDSMEDTRELVDPINNFPTANKPILDTTLKDMLVSLCSSLHADMMQCMKKIKTEVGELGGQIDHIEQKMGNFAASHNTLVDAHNDQSDDIIWLKAKVGDLADRSRRNNVKICEIPEAVQSTQLQQCAWDLMKVFLPSVPETDLVIDRIQRLRKPSHFPNNIRRDVLMRVHFYHAKEQLTTAFRKNSQPPETFSCIQLYADLSQFTMQKHKSLLPVTKALRNHSILYHWGYSTKLTITHEGNTTTITCLEEGLTLLCSLDIIPEQNTDKSFPPSRMSAQSDWQKVSYKKKNKKELLIISHKT